MRTTIALMLVIAATPAMAQLYRWTDQSGKTHFTDTPPPASAKKVEKKPGGAAPGGDAAGAGQPFVLQQAMRDNPVTLYTTEGCEACGEARKLLNARGVPFREVSVASEAQLSELKKAVGSNSVPAMLIGQNVVKGFETGQYNRALDDAGYPRAGILPARSQAEPAPATPAKSEPAAEQPATAPKGPYAR
jgi:glutaredoxin